jgi:hypothetical protein
MQSWVKVPPQNTTDIWLWRLSFNMSFGRIKFQIHNVPYYHQSWLFRMPCSEFLKIQLFLMANTGLYSLQVQTYDMVDLTRPCKIQSYPLWHDTCLLKPSNGFCEDQCPIVSESIWGHTWWLPILCSFSSISFLLCFHLWKCKIYICHLLLYFHLCAPPFSSSIFFFILK